MKSQQVDDDVTNIINKEPDVTRNMTNRRVLLVDLIVGNIRLALCHVFVVIIYQMTTTQMWYTASQILPTIQSATKTTTTSE